MSFEKLKESLSKAQVLCGSIATASELTPEEINNVVEVKNELTVLLSECRNTKKSEYEINLISEAEKIIEQLRGLLIEDSKSSSFGFPSNNFGVMRTPSLFAGPGLSRIKDHLCSEPIDKMKEETERLSNNNKVKLLNYAIHQGANISIELILFPDNLGLDTSLVNSEISDSNVQKYFDLMKTILDQKDDQKKLIPSHPIEAAINCRNEFALFMLISAFIRIENLRKGFVVQLFDHSALSRSGVFLKDINQFLFNVFSRLSKNHLKIIIDVMCESCTNGFGWLQKIFAVFLDDETNIENDFLDNFLDALGKYLEVFLKVPLAPIQGEIKNVLQLLILGSGSASSARYEVIFEKISTRFDNKQADVFIYSPFFTQNTISFLQSVVTGVNFLCPEVSEDFSALRFVVVHEQYHFLSWLLKELQPDDVRLVLTRLNHSFPLLLLDVLCCKDKRIQKAIFNYCLGEEIHEEGISDSDRLTKLDYPLPAFGETLSFLRYKNSIEWSIFKPYFVRYDFFVRCKTLLGSFLLKTFYKIFRDKMVAHISNCFDMQTLCLKEEVLASLKNQTWFTLQPVSDLKEKIEKTADFFCMELEREITKVVDKLGWLWEMKFPRINLILALRMIDALVPNGPVSEFHPSYLGVIKTSPPSPSDCPIKLEKKINYIFQVSLEYDENKFASSITEMSYFSLFSPENMKISEYVQCHFYYLLEMRVLVVLKEFFDENGNLNLDLLKSLNNNHFNNLLSFIPRDGFLNIADWEKRLDDVSNEFAQNKMREIITREQLALQKIWECSFFTHEILNIITPLMVEALKAQDYRSIKETRDKICSQHFELASTYKADAIFFMRLFEEVNASLKNHKEALAKAHASLERYPQMLESKYFKGLTNKVDAQDEDRVTRESTLNSICEGHKQRMEECERLFEKLDKIFTYVDFHLTAKNISDANEIIEGLKKNFNKNRGDRINLSNIKDDIEAAIVNLSECSVKFENAFSRVSKAKEEGKKVKAKIEAEEKLKRKEKLKEIEKELIKLREDIIALNHKVNWREDRESKRGINRNKNLEAQSDSDKNTEYSQLIEDIQKGIHTIQKTKFGNIYIVSLMQLRLLVELQLETLVDLKESVFEDALVRTQRRNVLFLTLGHFLNCLQRKSLRNKPSLFEYFIETDIDDLRAGIFHPKCLEFVTLEQIVDLIDHVIRAIAKPLQELSSIKISLDEEYFFPANSIYIFKYKTTDITYIDCARMLLNALHNIKIFSQADGNNVPYSVLFELVVINELIQTWRKIACDDATKEILSHYFNENYLRMIRNYIAHACFTGKFKESSNIHVKNILQWITDNKAAMIDFLNGIANTTLYSTDSSDTSISLIETPPIPAEGVLQLPSAEIAVPKLPCRDNFLESSATCDVGRGRSTARAISTFSTITAKVSCVQLSIYPDENQENGSNVSLEDASQADIGITNTPF